MIDNFKNIEFQKPDVPDVAKKEHLQKMASDLLNMITEMKAECEKTENIEVKDQAQAALQSLEDLRSKIQSNTN